MKASGEKRNGREVLRETVSIHPATEFVRRICDTFVELRQAKVCFGTSELVGGLASIEGISILALVLCKLWIGEKDYRCASSRDSRSGYQKSQHLMQLASKFRLPIIVFVTSSVSFPGIVRAESHESVDFMQHMFSQWHSKSPIILAALSSWNSGEVFGAWLGHNVLAFEQTRFSMIATCQGEHRHIQVEASYLHRHGVIDTIVSEPPGGVHCRRRAKLKHLKSALSTMLIELCKLSPEKLIKRRKDKIQRLSAIVSKEGWREERSLCDGTLFHASVINGGMSGQS